MRKAARDSSQDEGAGGFGEVLVVVGEGRRVVVGAEGSEKCMDRNVLVEPRPRMDGAGRGSAGPMSGERGGE